MPEGARALLRATLAKGPPSAEEVASYCAETLRFARRGADDAALRSTLAWVIDTLRLAWPTPETKTPAAEAFFSPGEDCLEAIREGFDRARRRADVCVFTITDDRITTAMLEAHRRGVQLRVISDNDKSYDVGSDIERLTRAGIAVRIDRTEHHMHHKFAIFDGEVLLTGSYNWTRSAAQNNEENIVVTREGALVRGFSEEFERLWKRFAP